MSLFQIGSNDPWLGKARELVAAYEVDAVQRDKAGGAPTEQVDLLRASGLTTINIPAQYGGAGASWQSIFRITREIATVDGSLAHLYGYQHIPLLAVYRLATEAQRERWLKDTTRRKLLWANSGNVAARSSSGVWKQDHWVVNGHRPFSSGSHVADYLMIAFEAPSGDRISAVIPTDREGLEIVGDWDGIGQTQTGSGTVRYRNVRVNADEVIAGASPEGIPSKGDVHPLETMTSQLAHGVLMNIFVGSALGALKVATEYTRDVTKPFVYSGVDKAMDDPWVQSTYGELAMKTAAALNLVERAGEAFDRAWDQGEDLTFEGRGEAAIEFAAANVFAGEVALEVTSKIFELTGARSATKKHGFDRFWRNVRTHTLHNPAEYKKRTVGKWLLTGEYPGYGPYR